MELHYPDDSLRAYIVDGAPHSTIAPKTTCAGRIHAKAVLVLPEATVDFEMVILERKALRTLESLQEAIL